MLDDDQCRVLVSRGSDLAGIPYRKLFEMLNVNKVKEAIENYLILSIEENEEESGNTPLHDVAGTDNEKALKFLLSNGASASQFMTP